MGRRTIGIGRRVARLTHTITVILVVRWGCRRIISGMISRGLRRWVAVRWLHRDTRGEDATVMRWLRWVPQQGSTRRIARKIFTASELTSRTYKGRI
jgi:hypothetical protein